MAGKELLPPLDKRQQSIFEEQTASWRKSATRVFTLTREIWQVNIGARYELGEIVRDMKGDESKYGENAVSMLAEFIGQSPNTLYQCMQFAVCYSREDLEKLITRCEKRNKLITWTHLELLSSVSGNRGSVRERRELETAIINEDMSVAELKLRIGSLKAGNRGNGKGRPVKMPKNALDGLGDLAKQSRSFLNRVEMWEECVFSKFATEIDLSDEKAYQVLADSYDTQLRMKKEVDTQVRVLFDILNEAKAKLSGESEAEPEVAEEEVTQDTGQRSPAGRKMDRPIKKKVVMRNGQVTTVKRKKKKKKKRVAS